MQTMGGIHPRLRCGLTERCMDARLTILFVFLVAGCRSSPRYDAVEAELRERNRELAEARSELEHYRGMSLAYQSHLARTADPSRPPGDVPCLPLREIALSNGTGGIDRDGQPGDDALQVVLTPLDEDQSAVKVPGQVVVLAYEIQTNGVKVPIGRWDVPPENLRKYWRNGLLISGFFLQMQWDKPPMTEKVRVAVRLTTLDGRVYETDRDVSVKPLLGLLPRPAVTMGKISVVPNP